MRPDLQKGTICVKTYVTRFLNNQLLKHIKKQFCIHSKIWFVDLTNIIVIQVTCSKLSMKLKVNINCFHCWCTTVYVAGGISAIKTVLCLFLHHTKFTTYNLYNNILVKSTNQFLQCTYTCYIRITILYICKTVFWYVLTVFFPKSGHKCFDRSGPFLQIWSHLYITCMGPTLEMMPSI